VARDLRARLVSETDAPYRYRHPIASPLTRMSGFMNALRFFGLDPSSDEDCILMLAVS
jgi:hypothetical protein